MKFKTRLNGILIIFLGLQCIGTLIMEIFNKEFVDSLPEYKEAQYLQKLMITNRVPVEIARTIIALVLIVMIRFNLRFYNNVVIKSDPMRNGNICCGLIIFV